VRARVRVRLRLRVCMGLCVGLGGERGLRRWWGERRIVGERHGDKVERAHPHPPDVVAAGTTEEHVLAVVVQFGGGQQTNAVALAAELLACVRLREVVAQRLHVAKGIRTRGCATGSEWVAFRRWRVVMVCRRGCGGGLGGMPVGVLSMGGMRGWLWGACVPVVVCLLQVYLVVWLGRLHRLHWCVSMGMLVVSVKRVELLLLLLRCCLLWGLLLLLLLRRRWGRRWRWLLLLWLLLLLWWWRWLWL
jgi:hypothetical protein